MPATANCKLETGNSRAARGVWDLEFVISRSGRALCFSKYLSLFVRTYPDLYRNRRRHARLRLNLNLNLSLNLALNLDLHLNLNLFLFEKSLQKPFESSSGSSFGLK